MAKQTTAIHSNLVPSMNRLVTGVKIKSPVVEALFECYFKVLQPIKLILNIPKTIRSYPRYAKLKYDKLQ